MKFTLELVLVLFIGMFRSGFPYIITVDADDEECFFDKVEIGKKLGLTFEVIEGGFLDIDVRVLGPEGEEIITRERESNGKITFSASKTGVYSYCFSNKMSTLTPKGVMFSIDVGETPTAASADTEEHLNKSAEMIKELLTALVSAKHEQEYMEVRDRIHRRISESTNTRVVMWCLFESIILLSMTVGQVYYLKRFFEVRRVV